MYSSPDWKHTHKPGVLVEATCEEVSHIQHFCRVAECETSVTKDMTANIRHADSISTIHDLTPPEQQDNACQWQEYQNWNPSMKLFVTRLTTHVFAPGFAATP